MKLLEDASYNLIASNKSSQACVEKALQSTTMTSFHCLFDKGLKTHAKK